MNTRFNDHRGTISKDGLSLYFGSNRDPAASPLGTAEKTDLYVTQRESLTAPWGVPQKVAALNSAGDENAPAFSPDGHWVYFSSDRDGYCGPTRNYDLWASHRRRTRDNFGWETPIHLGCDINSPQNDDGPTYSKNENGRPALYFTSFLRPGGLGDWDIYVSPALGGEDGEHGDDDDDFDHVSFGPGTRVTELSTPRRDTRTALRRDGLEMYITSNRVGSVPDTTRAHAPSLDIWVATRATTADLWSTPVNAGAGINTPAADGAPTLSFDGTTLYFDSTRTIAGVSFGNRDLYVTNRTAEHVVDVDDYADEHGDPESDSHSDHDDQ